MILIRRLCEFYVFIVNLFKNVHIFINLFNDDDKIKIVKFISYYRKMYILGEKMLVYQQYKLNYFSENMHCVKHFIYFFQFIRKSGWNIFNIVIMKNARENYNFNKIECSIEINFKFIKFHQIE